MTKIYIVRNIVEPWNPRHINEKAFTKFIDAEAYIRNHYNLVEKYYRRKRLNTLWEEIKNSLVYENVFEFSEIESSKKEEFSLTLSEEDRNIFMNDNITKPEEKEYDIEELEMEE